MNLFFGEYLVIGSYATSRVHSIKGLDGSVWIEEAERIKGLY